MTGAPQVQDDGDEIFKICLEYWSHLAEDVFNKDMQFAPPSLPMAALMLGAPGLTRPTAERRMHYQPVFSRLRAVMISRMAKPEEVLIVEDENGEIVRETMKERYAPGSQGFMRARAPAHNLLSSKDRRRSRWTMQLRLV